MDVKKLRSLSWRTHKAKKNECRNSVFISSHLTSLPLSRSAPWWTSIPRTRCSQFLLSLVSFLCSFHFQGTYKRGTQVLACTSLGQHWPVFLSSSTPSYGVVMLWMSPLCGVISVSVSSCYRPNHSPRICVSYQILHWCQCRHTIGGTLH